MFEDNTCNDCSYPGNGDCPDCDGNGYCGPLDGFSRGLVGEDQSCDTCNGTGKCQTCNGDGYI